MILYSDALKLYKYNEQVNSKVLKICENFLNFLGLNYFSYGFFYNNCHFTVATNLKFLKYIFFNEIFSTNSQSFQDTIIKTAPYQTRPFIYNKANHKDKLQDCFYKFNVGIYTSFILREDSIIHWWTFGAEKENFDLSNELIGNCSLFKNFIKYFNHASSDFIAHDKKLGIIHPDYKIPTYDPSYDNLSQEFEAKLLKITNHYVNKKVYLTKREIECIKYLSQGKTAKEIAKVLELSPRTIETYLQNARLRVNVHSKSNLIDFFKNYYNNF